MFPVQNDIESNIRTIEDPQLRGILRSIQEEEPIQQNMSYKCCIFVFLLIIASPIIVADLYYAYTDNSCVNYYPGKLNMNMRIYLCVSAFVTIAVMFKALFMICVCELPMKKTPVDYIIGLFHVAWNIMGGIIYWGSLYQSSLCSRGIYNYLFATLIIKLICNVSVIANNKRKNENE
jgi:hypothetical protein